MEEGEEKCECYLPTFLVHVALDAGFREVMLLPTNELVHVHVHELEAERQPPCRLLPWVSKEQTRARVARWRKEGKGAGYAWGGLDRWG